MNEIVDHLFVSDAKVARDPAQLATHAIGTIVNLASRLSPAGVTVVAVHFKDRVDHEPEALGVLVRRAVAAIAAARSANQNVLVQCSAGVSRSPAIVVAYLVLARGMTLDDAVALVRQRHTRARPNAGVLAWLRRQQSTA